MDARRRKRGEENIARPAFLYERDTATDERGPVSVVRRPVPLSLLHHQLFRVERLARSREERTRGFKTTTCAQPLHSIVQFSLSRYS